MTLTDPRRTDAFVNLRSQIQNAFDFAYVVSQAIPALKLQISLIKKGTLRSLPNPDYFKNPNAIEIIQKQVKPYKGELCKHILLSSFSYFESYIVDVCQELIEFHDGNPKFIENAKQQHLKIINRQLGKQKGLKSTLRKENPKELSKLIKSTSQLDNSGYIFPTRLFFMLGVHQFAQSIGTLKASQFPDFIENCFGYVWTKEQRDKFHQIRDIRNNIAHGKNVSLDLSTVCDFNTFFRDMALSIDKFLVDLFFLSEKYI
jgi:hypothetical protein